MSGSVRKPKSFNSFSLIVPKFTSLSIAGGPTANADLENVKLIRKDNNNEANKYDYDLSKGGDEGAHTTVLKPGDSVFIGQNRFYENRAYYTSLTSVNTLIKSYLSNLSRLFYLKPF